MLNVHFHVLYLDGVYLRPKSAGEKDRPLTFHALRTPTRAETAEVARRIALGLESPLKKRGRSLDPTQADSAPTELELEQPTLAQYYGAAALGVAVNGAQRGQPTLPLVSGDALVSPEDREALPEEPVAEVSGVNLYGVSPLWAAS